MLENYKSTEVTRAKEMISSIKKDIKGIDEKYKKIAELEKKALVSACAAYQSIIDFWDKLGALSAPVQSEETKEVEIPDATQQVVDTIFPENNNTSTDEEEPETEEAETTEEDIPAEEDLPLFENPSEKDSDKDTDPEDTDIEEEDEDWGDMPEEWK